MTGPIEQARILVVDDQEDNRVILSRRLVRAGYQVETAINGEDALEAVAHAPPDLILLDYMMPDLSGLDVLRRLRADAGSAQVPVIMVTARSDEEAVVECLTAGANDYVCKPISFPVLKVRMEAQLARQRALADLRVINAELEDRVARRTFELHQHNIALREAHKKLEQSDRAKSLFLATMSHELRTPLNAIIGLSELMRNEALGPIHPPSYRDFATKIRQGGAYLHDLVSAILDSASFVHGDVDLADDNVDLKALVEACVLIVDTGQGQTASRLHCTLPDVDITVRGDACRLKQVILNILSNALKFSPEDSPVSVEMRLVGPDVAIDITDLGPGIPEDRLRDVLSPFIQISNQVGHRTEGIGLGLTIAHEIVSRHAGSIAIGNRDGGGLKVTVFLPLPETDSAARTGTACA